MDNKHRYLVIGSLMVLAVSYAVAETNVAESATETQTTGTESVVAAETNAPAAVVAEATNTVAEVTNVPVEETKAAPEKRDKFDFIIGVGLVAAPEYGDYLDDVYGPLYSGLDDYEGWVDLYLGFEYRPVSRFGIIVGGDLWINGGVDASGGPFDESYANTIIIPSIYGQLYLTKSGWLYVNAGVNFPIPDTGSKYFEFNSDGTGFGVNIGVEIADILRIEAGYVSVPVNVEATSKNLPTPAFDKDYDFGGAQVRVLLAF